MRADRDVKIKSVEVSGAERRGGASLVAFGK